MMNQQEILRKIGRIIQELQEQQLYLSQTTDINLLELELFTANADFLLDHIEVLKKLSLQVDVLRLETNPSVALEIIVEKSEFDELIIKEEEIISTEIDKELIEDKTSEKPIFDFVFEEEPVEMVFDFENETSGEEVFDKAFSNEEIQLSENEAKSVEKANDSTILEVAIEEEEEGPEPFLIIKEETEQEKLPTKEEQIKNTEPINPVKEKFVNPDVNDSKLTLNEMLSAQKEQKNSILKPEKSNIDLKTTISLNDKMIFIKDLFNGYNLAYSEAVEIINRFESFEAADNFLLKNYAQKNNWANKQDVVDRFYEYLNRKFGV